MTLYRCDVCNVFEYDSERGNSLTEIRPGTEPADFPKSWECPICASDPTHLRPVPPSVNTEMVQHITCPVCGVSSIVSQPGIPGAADPGYLSPWERRSDSLEEYMADIRTMAVTGESIIEPMRTKKPVVSWDDILIKGAQIATLPLNRDT
jgi:rubredoxin